MCRKVAVCLFRTASGVILSKYDIDLCVIGGGSAGLVTAAGAAQLGARVVLIEATQMGGECLNSGCVPSKALLRSAEVAASIRNSTHFGLPSAYVVPELPAVMKHVADVIGEIAPHDNPERFRGLGVDVIPGHAEFEGPHRIKVATRTITSRWVVIATGSKPFVPSIPGLESVRYLTNENIFQLLEPVKHLLILGGGPIGLELAQAFIRLGTRVTVIEAAPQVLPQEDSDVAEAIRIELENEGVHFVIGAQAKRIAFKSETVRLHLVLSSQALTVTGSHLLIATGRRPRIDGLNLLAAGIQAVDGKLEVDDRLRTNQKHIYACGDVVGPYRFTHMAEHQAGIVLRNMIFRIPATTERTVIPRCTFTDPEVASVGLSENDAKWRCRRYDTFRIPFSAIDRAITERRKAGFVKVLATPRGRLLGATIVGAHAGELIHEYALALRHGMTLRDISACIHAYPTYSQANRFAADARFKQKLSPSSRKWIQRIFRLQGAR